MAADVELIACPHCGGGDHHLWARESGFDAVKCDGCGLVYVNPRPGSETITEANKIGLHRTASGEQFSVKARRHPLRIARYKAILREMFGPELAAGLPVRWLDVGAGYGEFVEAVVGVFPNGSDISGIEPMQAKTAVARRRGLPISDRALHELDDQYDAVSLINVFSHIPDFIDFGAAICARIKPGGVLFMETGNGGDLVSRSDYPDKLYLPDHLVFAGAAHIEQIAAKLGLAVEAVRQEPIDNPLWCLKVLVRDLLDSRLTVKFPYASPFRTMFYKCRKS
jgi:2-polyprenyl-3-methyl-5-hydroxy-6-metoxy-1,4-benzoquinol methylase